MFTVRQFNIYKRENTKHFFKTKIQRKSEFILTENYTCSYTSLDLHLKHGLCFDFIYLISIKCKIVLNPLTFDKNVV